MYTCILVFLHAYILVHLYILFANVVVLAITSSLSHRDRTLDLAPGTPVELLTETWLAQNIKSWRHCALRSLLAWSGSSKTSWVRDFPRGQVLGWLSYLSGQPIITERDILLLFKLPFWQSQALLLVDVTQKMNRLMTRWGFSQLEVASHGRADQLSRPLPRATHYLCVCVIVCVCNVLAVPTYLTSCFRALWLCPL